MTSPGSARNARPRRNAVSKDASSAAPAPAPAVQGRAATVTKASKTAAAVKTAAPGTTKRAANGRAAAASAVTPTPVPAGAVKNGKAPKAPSRTRDDKDRPLFEDIRYLGRLLGDVVREQEGDEVFDIVETIRQTAVKFRREEDNEASQTLEKRLKSLSPEQTVSVVRAFSYFSHLANIAEDRHHNRRRRIHALAGSAPQPGTMAYAIERLKASPNAKSAKATLQKFFDDALIVPVLTAHPTEVSRKSILDAQHEVARLLAERDQELTARERAHNEAMLRSRVTSLWQTRMLRDARLTVADEIENALSYYHATFLEEIPALYADIEAALTEHGLPARLPPFLQMGSWIGGDRDGNPERHRAHARARHHAPGHGDLRTLSRPGSQTGRGIVGVAFAGRRERCVEDARRCIAGHSPHRIDEPYRRALIGVYARLVASADERLGSGVVPARSRHPAKPYASAAEFAARPERADRIARRASRRVFVGAAFVAAGARG